MHSDGFGRESYSKEELTAKWAAAFLCGICQIEQTTLNNSAAYIQGWLKALQNDKTLLVKAAAQAQAAADYIVNTLPPTVAHHRTPEAIRQTSSSPWYSI